MAINTELELRQTWGGHEPILRALMRELRPKVAVECGSGKFSTGVMRSAPRLWTIEHDWQWAARVRGELGEQAGHEWVIEGIEGINNSTARQALMPRSRSRLDEMYRGYAERIGRHELLFVDTFTAARVPAVLHLGPLAEVIAIHDTERDWPMGYGLGECEEVLSGMHRYSYQPHGQTAEFHPWTWTEVFSRWPLDQRQLTEAARPWAADIFGGHVWLVALGVGATYFRR